MEWWSAQLGLQRHMQTHKATHTCMRVTHKVWHLRTGWSYVSSFHIFIFLNCLVSAFVSFLLSVVLSKRRTKLSSVFNTKACQLIRESFPVCPKLCRQPVSPSTSSSTHTHTHTRARVSTSPPLTGRCHLRRQLQSLVWLLSSNQRPSSLSTATWPWGYRCHTVHTRLQLTPPKRHISYTNSSIWGRRKQEV